MKLSLFEEFLRQYRIAVTKITHYSSLFSLVETWMVGVTSNKINDQLSLMMPDCFPGENVTLRSRTAACMRCGEFFQSTTTEVKAENEE